MNKYKNMTYTIRSDGRLMKKVTINKKPKYIYSNDVKDLYNQYIELKFSDLNGTSVESITFKIYAENWLKLNSKGKSDGTIEEYKQIVKNKLIKYLGNMKINKIKPMDIGELTSDLLEEGHVSAAYKCRRFAKTIFDDAILNGYLTVNPAQKINLPKLVRKEKHVLTAEEDKLLLKSEHPYAPFFRIMRYTGLRREEIAPLTINDVDIENKTLNINKAFSYTQNQPKLKTTKNKKSRTIPILDIIYNDIVSTINSAKANNSKYLFTKQRSNTVLTKSSLRRILDDFCNDIGFKFTFHQLRHSYCTMLYYSGITIKQTQRLMGHSSADMVYNIYAHLDEQKEDVINKVNKYINNKDIKAKKKVVFRGRIIKI